MKKEQRNKEEDVKKKIPVRRQLIEDMLEEEYDEEIEEYLKYGKPKNDSETSETK